ncbi:MAG: hypothetical protein PHE51_06675 [Eubacteriales bacterium]|nr:hypothetical protein [Eubacteriales bacterium]
MKSEEISEITDKEYYVQKNCTFSRGKKKLCNFWIKELCINYCMVKERKVEVSFTITLKNDKKEKRMATFPILYLYEPFGWLHMAFDTDEFSTNMNKNEFDFHFNKILRSIKKHMICDKEYIIGWEIESNYDKQTLAVLYSHRFYQYDNPDEFVDEHYKNLSITFDEYMNIADKRISIPLVCYTLLAVINSLLAKNIKQVPDFIFSITGAEKQKRMEFALFYTNLYKRNFRFNMRDYRYTHIMPDDSLSDVYFKMMLYKDSVITAFEPSKKRMNQIDVIYNSNDDVNNNYDFDNYANDGSDADNPIYSLCLITAKNKTDIPFNTFNVELPSDVNLKDNIDERLRVCDGYGFKEYKDDVFMDCIYAYVYKLIQKVNNKEIIVKSEFIKLQNSLQANYQYQRLPDIAEVAVQYLCFAYKLYSKIMNPKVSYDEVESIIFDTAFIAYPQKDVVTSNDVDNAMKICNVIDNYFLNNKKAMNAIGSETSGNTKLWYDQEYFYINKEDVEEILALQKCEINFSPNIRQALADIGIIKTRKRLNNVSNKNTLEYCLHITKPLYGTYYSKVRYYTFSIEECKKNELFSNLCQWIVLYGLSEKLKEAGRGKKAENKV